MALIIPNTTTSGTTVVTNAAALPANPPAGTKAYRLDTNLEYTWDGGVWQTVAWAASGSWTMSVFANTSGWSNNYQYSVFRKVGGWVLASGATASGDNGPASGTALAHYVTLPVVTSAVAHRDIVGHWILEDSGTNQLAAGVLRYDNGTGRAVLLKYDGTFALNSSYLWAVRATFSYPV